MFLSVDYLLQIQRLVFLVIVISTIYYAQHWFHKHNLIKNVRGFKNIKIINSSLRKLFLSLQPSGLSKFSKDLKFLPSEINSPEEKTIWVQKVARRIADHFGIITSTIVVTFRSDLKAPGCVELSPASEFFVELRSDLKCSPDEIIATLAHEVAHIFLFRHGIKMEPVFQNEVLTDTTAIFLGCGASILNGSSYFIERSGNNETSSIRKLGYLSVDEFGYVLAKREKYFNKRTEQKINEGLPQKGYFRGWLRFISEKLLSRTLGIRKLSPITSLFKRGRNYDEKESNFLFPCSFCGQQLRVPILGKKLQAICPVCREKNSCYC